jgi:hypothetical protein
VARNPLLGLALLGVLTLAGCSGASDDAVAADAKMVALRAQNDSLRKARQQAPVAAAPADSASAQATLAATPAGERGDSNKAMAGSIKGMSDAEAAMADSVQKAREIEVMRETFAYAGGTRDPFNSLINIGKMGPEVADLDLVGVYQDLRLPSNSMVVLREKVTTKRHKMRVGDQLGRARLVQIRPRDAVFMIKDFGFERQETLSLRKQEVETP